jgi:hypothetical protein
MEFQGGSFEGGGYGDLSPKDYNGLTIWGRATDGIKLSRGAIVSSIQDISKDNGRIYTGGAGASITNTPYQLAIKGSGNGTPPSFESYGEFASFLVDGSPYSFFLVANSLNANSTGGGYLNTSNNVSNVWRLAPSNGSQIVRVAPNVPNTTIPLGGTNINYFLADINYGYAFGANNFRSYVNNVLKATSTYSANPTALKTDRFAAGFRSPHLTYEWFAYNNTGKSIDKIEAERDSLFEIYVKNRYKNFIP